MQKSRIALVIGLITIFAGSSAWGSGGKSDITSDEALRRMKDGNRRFIKDDLEHPHLNMKRRFQTAKHGQHPFATVIGCSDSRVPVEIVFDQGVGDLFVIRVAGNVCDTDEVGSIEYGVDHLATPLLVVLGHESCGAVTAVVEETTLHGSIPALVDNIIPAVEAAEKIHPNLKGEKIVPFAVRANVMQSIQDLLSTSEAARDRVKSGSLLVVGAVYNIENGRVSWLGEHPRMATLLKDPPRPSQASHGDDDDHGHGH